IGPAPDRLDVFDDPPPARPERLVEPAEKLGANVEDRGDLPEDVELKLLGRRIAHADGLRVLIAGKVVQLEFREPALTLEAVHDLDRRGVAGSDTQQEVTEGQRLLGVAGVEQRLKGENGVAEPAVAVI